MSVVWKRSCEWVQLEEWNLSLRSCMLSPHCIETLPFRKLFHPIMVCALNALSTFARSEGDVTVGRLWFIFDTVAMPARMVSHTGRVTCNFWRDWNIVSNEDLRDFLIFL